jgi:ribosomal-protein-alanine N-acetyltransferase
MRVLEKAGFRLEGSARQYLKIDGRWQDHNLYALLHHDLQSEPARG